MLCVSLDVWKGKRFHRQAARFESAWCLQTFQYFTVSSSTKTRIAEMFAAVLQFDFALQREVDEELGIH
jgi:hypothetical protein